MRILSVEMLYLLFEAKVMLVLWGWFIVPMGPPMTYWRMFGVNMLVGLFVMQPSGLEMTSEAAEKLYFSRLAARFGASVIALVFGVIIHRWLM